MSAPTQFTALLDSARPHAGGLALDVPADWAQGRSIFGGLQAAFAVRAMRAIVDPAIPLRSLQVTFIGPAAGTLHTTATVLRTAHPYHWVDLKLEYRLSQADRAVFGEAPPNVSLHDRGSRHSHQVQLQLAVNF